MTALKDSVVNNTLDEVQIVYINRETAKWWNMRRKVDDTAVFTGFFWIRGHEEAGPFKTRSAAIRDAYYRFVLRREPPGIGRESVYSAPVKVKRVLRPNPERKQGRPRNDEYVMAQ